MQRRTRCERTPEKIKYLDEASARKGASRRSDRYADQAASRPYLCDYPDGCGYWHNTVKWADRTPTHHRRTPDRGVR